MCTCVYLLCNFASHHADVGCLGCLASQDWGVRKAAAETLFALNRLLGPLLEHGASSDRKRVPRCVDALAAARHDRVRPVRDAVVLAIAAFTELTEWMDDNPVRSRMTHVACQPTVRQDAPDLNPVYLICVPVQYP